jgi:hypothetical protein
VGVTFENVQVRRDSELEGSPRELLESINRAVILVRLEEVHMALTEDAELSVFMCVLIKFTDSPGSYVLLANRKGGTLTTTTSPVPVTLAIGSASGTAQVLFIISFLTHDRAMAAKQLQRTDIGSEIAWLLETDDEYVIRLRQKPDSDRTRDVTFLMPLAAEWRCGTEVVARAAFRAVVSWARLNYTLFNETAETEVRRLKAECESANAAFKKASEETGDRLRIPTGKDP